MPAYLVSDLGPDADSDSDTGSHHHPSDDDGAAFVLPSFAYAVPDDVYAPARNRHHLHDQQQQQQQPVRDDSTPADPSTDGNAAHAAHAAHTAYTANADALEKIVHGTDREPTSETQVKAGAAEPAQRVPSSSTTPSSLLIIQPDNQATVTKPKPMPQSKPVPATPALDAYTKLAMQGLCGLSSTSPSPSPPAPRQQQQQQGRTQTPVAPAPLALRVDDPSFLSYQQQKGVPQQYQQAQPPQQQQQQQQATSSPPPWSQPPRALPPHMTDLITTDTMPPQPIVEAGTSPLQDLQSLVAFSEPVQLAPAPAPRTRPSISPLTLSPRSPRPSSPSLVDLFTDLSTSPCPRVPSPPASTTDTQQQQPYAYDELTQGSSLISPQPGDSSEYPSTFSSYQDSAPGSHSSFRSTTSQAPCEPNMLDPNKICFEYLRQLLRKGDSVCVRVEGPKNNQLQWTGDSATSGYFGRQDAFKGLAPDAYQKAVRAVGLDRPNWESQEYLWRSMDAHRWPDQGCVPEDSPWISATTNLEWAIWRTANILTSSSHVYMTFIKPTTERYSLPKPPRSRSKKGQSFQDLHKGNSEVLFYGRIFADSIVARIKWTRTVSYSYNTWLRRADSSHFRSRCPRGSGASQPFGTARCRLGSTTSGGRPRSTRGAKRRLSCRGRGRTSSSPGRPSRSSVRTPMPGRRARTRTQPPRPALSDRRRLSPSPASCMGLPPPPPLRLRLVT